MVKRFELKFRWNDWTRVGRSEVWFERSEDLDLEEVELERVEKSLRSLRSWSWVPPLAVS